MWDEYQFGGYFHPLPVNNYLQSAASCLFQSVRTRLGVIGKDSGQIFRP